MMHSSEPTIEPTMPEGGGDEYEAVEGLDRKSIELERQIEAKAAEKTASDYQHIIWAYGVLWALFAVYGIILWRKALSLRSDMAQLQRRIDRKGS